MKISFENVNYHSIQVLLEVVQKENTSNECNIVNTFHNSNEEPRTLSFILKLLNIKIRQSNAMHVWMVTEALRIPNFTFAVNLSLHPSEADKLNITANSRIVLLNKAKHLSIQWRHICLFTFHKILPYIFKVEKFRRKNKCQICLIFFFLNCLIY